MAAVWSDGECTGPKWSKMVQNGPNDHFGQNDLIPNWILALTRPKWTKMVHFGPFWPEEVHFGPFRSANRTLAIPEIWIARFPWRVVFFSIPVEFALFCLLGSDLSNVYFVWLCLGLVFLHGIELVF